MSKSACQNEDEGLPPVTRGDTWHFGVELSTEEAPEDLTGASLWVTLKKTPDEPDSASPLNFEYIVPNGAAAESGTAVIRVPSDLTALVPADTYLLGLRRVIPGTPPDVWTFYRQRRFVVDQMMATLP